MVPDVVLGLPVPGGVGKNETCLKSFEGDGLLAYDVEPRVDLTKMQLGQVEESVGTSDEFLDSNLARYRTNREGEEENSMSVRNIYEGW